MEPPSAIAPAPASLGPVFPGCCSRHGDAAGDEVHFMQFPNFRVDLITISGIEVPLSRFAFTQGLGNYVRRELECAQKRPVSDKKSPTSEVTVTVSPSFVCRVHITHPCTYGAQCKFAHVCPEVCQTALVRALQQQLPASVRDSFREAVASRSISHSPSFSHGVSAVASLAASGSSVDIVSRRASSNVNQPMYGHGGGAYAQGDPAIVPGTALLTHYTPGGAPSHTFHAPLVQSAGPLPHVVHLQPQGHLPLPPQGPVLFGGALQHPAATQSMPYHQSPHQGFARLMQPYESTGALMQPHSAMPVTSLHSSPQVSFALNARGEVGYGPQSVMMQPLPMSMHPASIVASPSHQHQPSSVASLPYVYADPNSATQPLYAYAPQGQPVPPGPQQSLPVSLQPPVPSYYVVMGHPPPR